MKNLLGGFEHSLKNHPHNPALEIEGKSLSYSELFDKAQAVAQIITQMVRCRHSSNATESVNRSANRGACSNDAAAPLFIGVLAARSFDVYAAILGV